MGKSLAGNIIYYWIFVIGAMFFGHIFNLFHEPKDYIVFLIIVTLIYWGIAFLRFAGNKKREAKKAETVARYQSNKKNKKKRR